MAQPRKQPQLDRVPVYVARSVAERYAALASDRGLSTSAALRMHMIQAVEEAERRQVAAPEVAT